MSDLQNRLNEIPEGTSERNLDVKFVCEFLIELGFSLNQIDYDTKLFKGLYKDKYNTQVKPDFVCYSGEFRKSAPILIIENKNVQDYSWNDAVEKIEKSLLVVGSNEEYKNYCNAGQFGIAINGIFLQLFQRHGKICVPRTAIYKLQEKPIDEIIEEIKLQINNPRRALTTMFWNNKGGVGKTTITAHIGTALSTRKDTKVLLINFDLQGDLNLFFGLPFMTDYQNEDGIDIYKLLEDVGEGDYKIDENKLIKEINENLSIIPGDMSMFDFEIGEFAQRDESLKLLCKKYFYDKYDYIFIDASPSWRGMGEVAAVASDIIIPIIDSKFSLIAGDRISQIYLNTNYPKGKWKLKLSEIPPKIHGFLINRLNKNDIYGWINKIKDHYSISFFDEINSITERAIPQSGILQNIDVITLQKYVSIRNKYNNSSHLDFTNKERTSSMYTLLFLIAIDIFETQY